MNRRIALSLMTLAGVASLSACRRAPLMLDIKQSVPPWLEDESLLSRGNVADRLGIATFRYWDEIWPTERRGYWQRQAFKAPPDMDMQQVLAYYEQHLGDARWQRRRESEGDFDAAVWHLDDQALVVCWYRQPVQWGDERVRVISLLATAAARSTA